MKRWLTLASAMLLICSLGTAAKADVSWDFIITAAINNICPECPASVPTTAGSLTVSDEAFLRGSLFYSYYVEDPPFPDSDLNKPRAVIVGDENFSLAIGIDIRLPINSGAVDWVNVFENGLVDISFSPAGKISGLINDNNRFSQISMNVIDSIVMQAWWASDGTIPGCGNFTQCIVDGHWQLTTPLPIPEPSSVGILAGAVAALGLLGRRRKTTGTSTTDDNDQYAQ